MTCWTIMHHNPNFEAIRFLAIRNHPILSLIGCVSIYDLVYSSMRNKDKYYPKEGTSLKSIATLLRPLVEAAGGYGILKMTAREMIIELDHGLMGCSVLAFFARAMPDLFPLKKYKDVSVHRWALMALLFSSAREHYAFGGTLDDDSVDK
ncbi:hypothetical protein NC652_016505 [Populus alba x Populus x berolinensis]|nr:hypothetical protein NC652_016505 [Populus alba x Populus x berolinensis]